jgi:3-methyladenine DNA glycosylase AlkD
VSTVARTFVNDIVDTLSPLANAERAAPMAAYMKHHFEYLGIVTPQRRDACRLLIRTYDGNLLAAVSALWKLDEREYQYVACDLLRQHARKLQADNLPKLEKLVTSKSWWDSVDGLVPSIGALVLREPQLSARMDELIDADNFWLQRVAILHQLAWKNETDQERLFRYCLHCADDNEFFIRKAIGWALRQHARVAPDAVRTFIKKHQCKLSPLSIREAGKHL